MELQRLSGRRRPLTPRRPDGALVLRLARPALGQFGPQCDVALPFSKMIRSLVVALCALSAAHAACPASLENLRNQTTGRRLMLGGGRMRGGAGGFGDWQPSTPEFELSIEEAMPEVSKRVSTDFGVRAAAGAVQR